MNTRATGKGKTDWPGGPSLIITLEKLEKKEGCKDNTGRESEPRTQRERSTVREEWRNEWSDNKLKRGVRKEDKSRQMGGIRWRNVLNCDSEHRWHYEWVCACERQRYRASEQKSANIAKNDKWESRYDKVKEHKMEKDEGGNPILLMLY